MIKRARHTVGRGLTRLGRKFGYVRTQGFQFRPFRTAKVFCIGRNKTGTTSLKVALEELGYIMGNQREAERLIDAYAARAFNPIVEYCRSAEAFQDVPFSWPYTYVVLDQAFPESKFILTIRRGGGDASYASLVRHQTQRLGLDRLPTPSELKQDPYVYRGWSYDVKHALVPKPDDALYDKDFYISLYKRHNLQVKQYFAHRPQDLLVLDVSAPDAYRQLCEFLDVAPVRETMPWKNKTNR